MNAHMMRPWQILADRPLIDRQPWLTVWEEDVELPNGHRIEGYLRARSREYAEIFALLENGTVPVVRQYKHGIGRESFSLPAGYLDGPDEAPLAAARRELREETGLTAEHWRALGSYVLDTNRSDARAHFFLATGARADGPQQLDATEDIEVTYHTLPELRAMLAEGAFDSLPTVAIVLLGLDALRQEPEG